MKMLPFLILAASAAMAADAPALHAIRGARIHTLDGPVIERGTILMENGRIKALGADVVIPSGAVITEANGLDAYPGIFDAISQIGLTEKAGLTVGDDLDELGDQPQLKAMTAINADSMHIGIARAGGVTQTTALPGLGGRTTLGGQASVVQLEGYTVEQMLLESAAGLVVNMPSTSEVTFDMETLTPIRSSSPALRAAREQKLIQLTEWFERAQRYSKAAGKAKYGLALEALLPYLRGEKPVLINADQKREILQGIDFCTKFGLKMVLVRGGEARLVKEKLAEKKIPVILAPAWALPSREDDPYDQPMTHAAELFAAGVKVAFASFSPTMSLDVASEAGAAVAYGLPPEEGLNSVTKNPAEIFGLGDQLGTLTPGKIANLILTDGDPLEPKTHVRAVFIQGRPTSMDNRQRALYERYKARE
jgi:imidazolonepropionase-like amidohydrolase